MSVQEHKVISTGNLSTCLASVNCMQYAHIEFLYIRIIHLALLKLTVVKDTHVLIQK